MLFDGHYDHPPWLWMAQIRLFLILWMNFPESEMRSKLSIRSECKLILSASQKAISQSFCTDHRSVTEFFLYILEASSLLLWSEYGMRDSILTLSRSFSSDDIYQNGKKKSFLFQLYNSQIGATALFRLVSTVSFFMCSARSHILKCFSCFALKTFRFCFHDFTSTKPRQL